MSTHVIKILAGYNMGPRKRELVLSDKGYSEVDPGTEIEWVIDDQSARISGSIAVNSIEAIDIDSGDKIFRTNPRRDQDNKMKGQIGSGLGSGKKCKYSIRWTGEDFGRYKHDPIIAVKPTTIIRNAPLPKIIAGLALGLGVFFALKYIQKRRIKINYL